MAVILISGDCFTRREALARALCERLSYRLIEPEVVIRNAARLGGDEEKSRRALTDPPSPGSIVDIARKQLLFLRAAVADEICDGNAVCCGKVAELVLHDDFPALRIQTAASRRSRIETAGRLFECCHTDAAAVLKSIDRARNDWLGSISGVRAPRTKPDLILHWEHGDVEAACRWIVRRLLLEEESDFNYAAIRLSDLAAASRLGAALAADPATEHLNLSVESAIRRISIHGHISRPEDRVEVQRLAETVAGGNVRLALTGVRGCRKRISVADLHRFVASRPMAACLVSGLILVAALGYSRWGTRAGAALSWQRNPQTIMGVITDSRCGHHHSQVASAGCVWSCVSNGARFVLDDGTHLYELSDQHAAGQYAAQRVMVKGFLRRGSRSLKVAAMEPM